VNYNKRQFIIVFIVMILSATVGFTSIMYYFNKGNNEVSYSKVEYQEEGITNSSVISATILNQNSSQPSLTSTPTSNDVISIIKAKQIIADLYSFSNDEINYSGIDGETGYYVFGWANPGKGTGGLWYVDPQNGNLFRWNKKIIDIKKEKQIIEENSYLKQIGYIKKIYTKNGIKYIDFDEIQWLMGEEAIKAMMEDYNIPKEEVEVYNDCYIRNKDEKIITLKISEKSTYTILSTIDIVSNVPSNFENIKKKIDETSYNLYMEICSKNGEVFRINEKYHP